MLFKSYVYFLAGLLLVGLFTSCDADAQYEELVPGFFRKGGVSGVGDYKPIVVFGKSFNQFEAAEGAKG
uniref:Tabimmunregulin 12 n=1 Tax=Tabanus yao TaxID=485572 RepID=IMMC_TABYA|nr:RecName: Full=Tabimmunregulin 12; Flags: Precursor [Tabanus yao]ABX80092.1 tabimmunregulin 12 [Tabanus yao]